MIIKGRGGQPREILYVYNFVLFRLEVDAEFVPGGIKSSYVSATMDVKFQNPKRERSLFVYVFAIGESIS